MTKIDPVPLQLDRRVGSGELYTSLSRHLTVELVTLPAADMAILGRGVDEAPVLVGIERKRISDLLQSVSSGRLVAGQLPELARQYHECWLLVEGGFLVSESGVLLRPGRQGQHTPYRLGRKQYLARDLFAFLLTLEHCAGIRVQHTRDAEESVQWLVALYRWWTAKAFDEHRAHLRMDRARDAVMLREFTLVERMAAELPGIGMDRALAVGEAFQTPLQMICASEQEWRAIPGIGKTLAAGIVRALQEGNTV